jgi:hypothetical protein
MLTGKHPYMDFEYSFDIHIVIHSVTGCTLSLMMNILYDRRSIGKKKKKYSEIYRNLVITSARKFFVTVCIPI